MRFVRHIEDAYGSLVEVIYYCCRLCYVEEPDPLVAAVPGGWWPCLDSELDRPEPCRMCGDLIGPSDATADIDPASRRAEGLEREGRHLEAMAVLQKARVKG